ncbi:MAG: class I tRNA ligase family protein, partial [Candidatus Korobacteraceae bacterium]
HAPNSRGRRSAQTALWKISEALVRLLAPIMSFTSDEIWQHLPTITTRPQSVHLSLFPKSTDLVGDTSASSLEQLRQEWGKLMAVRDEALKGMEVAKQEKVIGDRAEAAVVITGPESALALLQAHDLRALFIVSAVRLERNGSGNGSGGIRVTVEKAPGTKCERCWNYSVHVGDNADYPMVCERCSVALTEIEA